MLRLLQRERAPRGLFEPDAKVLCVHIRVSLRGGHSCPAGFRPSRLASPYCPGPVERIGPLWFMAPGLRDFLGVGEDGFEEDNYCV